MNTYKITSNTNFLAKRDVKFNSTLNIDYIDNRTKKYVSLKAGETIFLTIQSLPLSIHKLRIRGMIIVDVVNIPKPTKLDGVITIKPTKKDVEIVKEIISKKKKSTNITKSTEKQANKK